jgi:P4 family phage/plasmid primase-like protien
MSAHDEANLDGRFSKATSWYASQGWKIIPCAGIVGGRCTCSQTHAEPKDVGKHPIINSWNTEASDDVNTIAKWWERDSEANIGVFCRPSGFLVIDIDPRSGGHDSFLEFEKLVEGALPPTVEATTGEYTLGGKTQRGRHIFYRCSEAEELVGNLKAAGIKGIDIKHNGYVLIAPSRHFSGVNYEWVSGKAPWEIEIAEAPEELLAFLRKKTKRSGSGSTSTSLGSMDWSDTFSDIDFGANKAEIEKILEEGIDEGSRAVDIYKLTCSLANQYPVDKEHGRQALETLMIRFNAEKVRPPMPLEGQNGLLMHVRRAMSFIADNPKINMKWPGISDVETGWAKRSTEETQAKFNPDTGEIFTALTGVVQPRSDALPGTLAGAVSTSIYNGESIEEASSLSNLNVPKDVDAINEEDGGVIGMRTLSDTGNGRRFVDTFGVAVRYSEGLGWFNWNGSYWKPDVEGLEMQELAKNLAPVIASEVTKYPNPDDSSKVVDWAKLSKSNARIKSAIDNANSDRRIRVAVDQWDSNPHMLGVLNGVVDLRSGELLKNRPDLYITRRAPVAYTPGLSNVRWQQFIDFATGGDKEYQEWLQKAAGYSLTGLSKYDLMFLVYGPAGSGKNTFVEAIVKCLGTEQYAWPFDSSILASGDGHASGSDLYHWAELRGRRLVWVDELPDSERLKENSVKKLTGSSEISARSPGERPFTFKGQAKLWISTNHRPIITDDAMWRRIRPIPFNKVPENPDPDLKDYIFDPEGALPAVLSWAVEGAIKMLNSSSRDALGWCSVVSEAAEVYRKHEDRIGLFIEEETIENVGATTSIKSLYSIYRIWAEERGEKPMSQTAFQRKMMERNADVVGHGSQAIINGRSLRPRQVMNTEIDWQAANRFAR